MKKTNFIMGILGVALLIFFADLLLAHPVRFHIAGADTPIANTEIEVIYDPVCRSSPCNSKTIFKGKTDEKGQIFIKGHSTKDINVRVANEGGYEYFFRINGYIRTSLETWNGGRKAVYLGEYVRVEDEPVELFFAKGRSVVLSNGYLYKTLEGVTLRGYTFLKLLSTNLENQTADMEVMTGYGTFKSFNLSFQENAYIPGVLTETKLKLLELNEDTAKVIMLPSIEVDPMTYQTRIPDFSKEIEESGFQISEALESFSKTEEEFDAIVLPFHLSRRENSIGLKTLIIQNSKCFYGEYRFNPSYPEDAPYFYHGLDYGRSFDCKLI